MRYVSTALLTLAAMASFALGEVKTTLDWYEPRVSFEKNCYFPEGNNFDCAGRAGFLTGQFLSKIRDVCKQSSCSGTTQYGEMKMTIEGTFPSEAHDEVLGAISNVLLFMATWPTHTDASEVQYINFGYPSKMILVRDANGEVTDAVTITFEAADQGPACEFLKKVGALSGPLGTAGAWLGAISAAAC